MTLETDIAVLTATPGFSGDVIPKGDPSYTKAIARWSLTSIREANLVVYPKDATSISVTITWATSRGFPLAVKGGGHSQSGASSIEDGVVIDLEGYLGGVRVDPDTKRAFIGGGAIWETVNEETIKYGLATVRAYCNIFSWTISILPDRLGGRSVIQVCKTKHRRC